MDPDERRRNTAARPGNVSTLLTQFVRDPLHFVQGQYRP
jgi:hypothetical protein